MLFVQQSAGRILRAIFEICLKRGWLIPIRAAVDLCIMVDKQLWASNTPLRQFRGVPADVIRKAEGKQFPWYRYFDLASRLHCFSKYDTYIPIGPLKLGELIGIQNAGKLVHRLVHNFPKLAIQAQAQVQPITCSLLRIDLTITPDF
ncbi:Sec63 domain-containing protein [Gautieria morchelliformis]|nr:Sec63 domain-containing protein [Gautieria morchelliformis]